MNPDFIALLRELSAAEARFEEAWEHSVMGRFGDLDCHVIGREAFIRNKRALGRSRDLADLEAMGE